MKIIQAIDVRWYNACADFALTQARALERLGHQVLLLADPGSPPAVKAKEMGLSLDERVRFSSLNIAISISRLNRIIKQFDPDVIIAHRGESHLVTALAARKYRIPVVRFRGDVRIPRSDIFSRTLNEKMTAGIAVATRRLKTIYAENYKLNGVPLEVIYPGVDLSRFPRDISRNAFREKLGVGPGDVLVGIVGRLSPVKGHDVFLRAVSKAQGELAALKIVIAGEDAQLKSEDILKSAAEFGIKNLKTRGRIHNIEELMAALDIGVVASIGSEMICRVLLEYYAAGIAVVGSTINQVDEIMALSRAGIPVPPGDADSMAGAILSFAYDSNLRREHGRIARKWVETDRSLENLALDTDNFLRKVIDG
jgi:glycosyltransferase involved in cell wall biosynthesis